jgi:thiol-disulfide isomerase/thioredoxin
MYMRTLFIIVPMLLLAACTPPNQANNTPPDSVMEKEEDAMMEKKKAGEGMQSSTDAMMKNEGGMEKDNTMKDTKTEGDTMMKEKAMKKDNAMIKDEGMKKDSAMENDAMMKRHATYSAYSDSVLANGETKVLYFYAGWCPKCRAHDERLSAWYPSDDFAYSVYKIDYDSSTELKQRYGVVQQHTFVLVDGQGNKISSVSYPDDAGLQEFLQG